MISNVTRGTDEYEYQYLDRSVGFIGNSSGDRDLGKGDWKLIRFLEDGRGGQHEELHNLRKDLGETVNLAEAEMEKRAELSRLLTEWAEEIETCVTAIEPEPSPEYVPWPDREPCGHFAVEGEGGGAGDGMDAADPRV